MGGKIWVLVSFLVVQTKKNWGFDNSKFENQYFNYYYYFLFGLVIMGTLLCLIEHLFIYLFIK